MRIGIVGAGHIGEGIARQLGAVGHELRLSFSRDPATLSRLQADIGGAASIGDVPDAVGFGDVVALSVPWSMLPAALEQAGSLEGKVVVDTTNQFGDPPLPPEGETAAHSTLAACRRPLQQVVQHADVQLPGRGGDARGRPASCSGCAVTMPTPTRSSPA